MSSDCDYSDCNDEFSSDKVKKSAKLLLKMSPKGSHLKDNLKENLISVMDLKRSLEKVTIKEKRKSNRNNDKKKIEDCFRDITADISTKLETMANVVIGALDRINQIEERLDALEGYVGDDAPSYASVTAFSEKTNIQVSDIKERLDFSDSEKIRASRLLMSCITHPSINRESENLKQDVISVMRNEMNMDDREIDKNMQVTTSKRENTVVVSYSDQRFKKFTFTAKKKLRENNIDHEGLYVNDYLTSFNYNILNSLRMWKKDRVCRGESCYESVYTYEGKVYIKMKSKENKSLYIKNIKTFEQLKSSFLN